MNNKSQKSEVKNQQTLPESMTLICFIMLALLPIFFSSCSSEKKATKSSLRSYTANHIVREIEENQFDFDYLETKFNVVVKGDNKIGLKGQMRMKNDSVIWISVSLKVGIEIGRVMITNDSLKFINRNAKTYIAESLDSFKGKLPVEPSLQFIQDLFVGNDTQIKDGDKYKVTTENDKYKLEITKREKKNIKNIEDPHILVKDVWVFPETFKISKYNIKEYDNDKRKVQLQYDKFQDFNGSLMPTTINFEISSDYDASIEINYSDIKVGEELDFPFNISKKFDRIYVW